MKSATTASDLQRRTMKKTHYATTASDLQPLLDLAAEYRDVSSHLRSVRVFFASGEFFKANSAALKLPKSVRKQLPQFVRDQLGLA